MKKMIYALSLTLITSLSTISYSVSFGNPFGVMGPDRKITKSELIKAVRLMAAAEFEAIQNYMQVAESTDDALSKKVCTDIANEERVHAGEFLRLLNYLDPEENTFYQKGATEVETEIKKLEPKSLEPKPLEQKIEQQNITKSNTVKPEISKPATPTAEKTSTKNDTRKETLKLGNVNVLVEANTVSVSETNKSINNIQKQIENTEEKIKKEPKEIKIIEDEEIVEEPLAIEEIESSKEEEITKPIILESIKPENTQKPASDESDKPDKIKSTNSEPLEIDELEEEIITGPSTEQPTKPISKEIAIENTYNQPTEEPVKKPEPVKPEEPTKQTEQQAIKEKTFTGKSLENSTKNNGKTIDIKKLITEKLNAVTKKSNLKNSEKSVNF